MACSVSITVFPVGERSLVRDNDNLLLFAPPRDKWMQEMKLVLEPPTPLSIPPALTKVGPGAGLGGLKEGASKERGRETEEAGPRKKSSVMNLISTM